MSLKWQRVKAWDDAFFPPWAWPAKVLLRTFSSITLAVILLSGVVLYGILASVPIGMLALIPTWLIYAASFIIAVGGVTSLAMVGLAGPTRPLPRAGRFALRFLAAVGVAVLAAWAYTRFVWPHLEYHPPSEGVRATGFRLFADFAAAYQSTTLRRLPGVEMTELEFYSAWPMRLLLLLFVLNMVVATVRRIAFEFVNIGVLTVHTGIVLIALGSIYYSTNKREGDMLLPAGAADDSGNPAPGPPVGFFYDNTQTVLIVDQWRGPEQRRLTHLPRYNDYNLDAAAGQSVWDALGRTFERAAPDGGSLDAPIEAWRGPTPLVDPDIQFRMVGYASYAQPQTDWVRVNPAESAALLTGRLNPLRVVNLAAVLPESPNQPTRVPFFFLPAMPAHRVADTPAFAIEYLAPDAGALATGLPEDPTAALSLPDAGLWGLWVRVPGAPTLPEGPESPPATTPGALGDSPATGLLWTVEPGRILEVAGYRLEITDISPEPPFPIVTEGYRGATSPVAQVRITPPASADAQPYTRWVYARYPEINQDLLELSPQQMADGMQGRRDADPALDIRLIDASKLQVTIREALTPARAGAVTIRQRGGGVRTIDVPDLARPFEILQGVTLELSDAWPHAEAFERPVPIPTTEQDRQTIGTHQNAMVAIEVSIQGRPNWRQVVWLAFTQYADLQGDRAKDVVLPDGRRLRLMFGRLQHRLPGFRVGLLDFEMLAYDHRGAPRDYQSRVRVEPLIDAQGRAAFEPFDHVTKLNAPLTAPFLWDPRRPLIQNIAGRLAAGLDPDQFKFSQAGWDSEGWRESQSAADQGLLPRPIARFTILGVGNNPGIHVIALGGILMALGIPWAFYVKPWLVRRRRDQLAAGMSTEPQRRTAEAGAES